MFTWIPIYEEIAAKLLTFESRQAELLELLGRLRAEGLKVIQLNDRDAHRNVFPLAEIDPLTFFSSFNRTNSISGRQAILRRIKETWNLESPVPDDFAGVPLANAQNSWAIAYTAKREPGDVPLLWRVTREALAKNWRTFEQELFNEALGIREMGLARMTMSLFWMKPHAYLSFDKCTRAYFKQRGVLEDKKTASGYIAWMDKVVAQAGDNFPQISYDAYQTFDSEDSHRANDDADEPAVLKETIPTKSKRRYWTLSAGEGGEMWDDFHRHGIAAIGWDELGDLTAYHDKADLRAKLKELWPSDSSKTNDTHACWQFAHEMAIGDVIFAKQGFTRLLGYGVVEGAYAFDPQRPHFRHIRKVKWESRGECEMPADYPMATKTLTDVTPYPDLVETLGRTVGLPLGEERAGPSNELGATRVDERDVTASAVEPAAFTKAHAMDGLFMPEAQLDLIVARLRQKKALVLQGPPGVGKTFVARRLAYTLMGQKDDRRVAMVQFHPSYGYEDFIQGYRPSRTGGLERRDGVFFEFARQARNDPDRDWFFIIDEINRGNLAKIFGELLMLLEADKRGPDHVVSLTYSDKGELFYLPRNLHVIGTMNTADRSLAMVDYALRRRFAFVTLEPAVDTAAFGNWLMTAGASKALLEQIRTAVGTLNAAIDKERDLGERFRIGHSFFCPSAGQKPDETWFREIIQTEIKPLLEEYFDSKDKVENLIAGL